MFGGMISKFADYTKIGNIVNCDVNNLELQKDMDTLVDWVDTWQMRFNAEKCEVIWLEEFE